ncbi:MAG: tripartite tricarboxylate transporter TctB family protein [Lautropia sp.]
MSASRAGEDRVSEPALRGAGGPGPVKGAAPRGAGGDRAGAVLWVATGTAIAVGAWRMDRLERMQIKPWEVPGLVPGLLGVVLALLGVALFLRGGAPVATVPAAPAPDADHGSGRRTAIASGLALVYALGLVGHGMPFWLATTIFVAAFIAWIDGERQRALGRSFAMVLVRATGFGLAIGGAVHLLFEQVFLVRLP